MGWSNCSDPILRGQGIKDEMCVIKKGGYWEIRWLKWLIRAGQGRNQVIRRTGQPKTSDVLGGARGGNGVWTIWPAHYTDTFLTSNNFVGAQASQNRVILSVPSGAKFTIELNTPTLAAHTPSKMTLARRTTRHARAAPLHKEIIKSMPLLLHKASTVEDSSWIHEECF